MAYFSHRKPPKSKITYQEYNRALQLSKLLNEPIFELYEPLYNLINNIKIYQKNKNIVISIDEHILFDYYLLDYKLYISYDLQRYETFILEYIDKHLCLNNTNKTYRVMNAYSAINKTVYKEISLDELRRIS